RTSTTVIYTLSLHDALPIYVALDRPVAGRAPGDGREAVDGGGQHHAAQVVDVLPDQVDPAGGASGPDAVRPAHRPPPAPISPPRSEEHTSELQSRFDLVCRL